jgi:predicted lysophospholipase L1 biosynthesis ABC-type transport system permease subunit
LSIVVGWHGGKMNQFLSSIAILVVAVACLTSQIVTNKRIVSLERVVDRQFIATYNIMSWVSQVDASQRKLAEAVKTSTNTGMASAAQIPAGGYMTQCSDTITVDGNFSDTMIFVKDWHW